MTNSKKAKLKQDLIDKYGDFIVLNVIDAYFPLTSDLNPEIRVVEDNVIMEVPMSACEVQDWDDYKNLERIAKKLDPRRKGFMKTPESEKKYNDPEFMEDLKKRKAERDKNQEAFLSNNAKPFLQPYYNLQRANLV